MYGCGGSRAHDLGFMGLKQGICVGFAYERLVRIWGVGAKLNTSNN